MKTYVDWTIILAAGFIILAVALAVMLTWEVARYV